MFIGRLFTDARFLHLLIFNTVMKNLKYLVPAFLLAVITIVGCKSSTSPSNSGSNGPAINSFTAKPPSITAGDPTVLKWNLDGTQTSVSLDNGLGDQTNNAADSLVVHPSVTTTYTLSAKNANGTSTATVTVNVSASSSPSTLVLFFTLSTDFSEYLAPLQASGVPYDVLSGVDGRQFTFAQIAHYSRVVVIQGAFLLNSQNLSTLTQYLDQGNKKLAIISDEYDNIGGSTLGDANHANIGGSITLITRLNPQFRGQDNTAFSGLLFTGINDPKNSYVETATINPGSPSKAAIISTDTSTGSDVLTAIQATFSNSSTFLYSGMTINHIDSSHQNAYVKGFMSF